jgi:hypothetical protein
MAEESPRFAIVSLLLRMRARRQVVPSAKSETRARAKKSESTCEKATLIRRELDTKAFKSSSISFKILNDI